MPLSTDTVSQCQQICVSVSKCICQCTVFVLVCVTSWLRVCDKMSFVCFPVIQWLKSKLKQATSQDVTSKNNKHLPCRHIDGPVKLWKECITFKLLQDFCQINPLARSWIKCCLKYINSTQHNLSQIKQWRPTTVTTWEKTTTSPLAVKLSWPENACIMPTSVFSFRGVWPAK